MYKHKIKVELAEIFLVKIFGLKIYEDIHTIHFNPLQRYLDNHHILLQVHLDHLLHYHIHHYLAQLHLVDSLCVVVML